MHDRRRFLKVLGASTLAWGSAACGGSAENGSLNGAGAPDGGIDGTAGSGGAGGSAGAAGGCGSGTPAGTAVGKLTDFPSAGLYPIPSISAYVGRDAGGLYAISSLCTHQYCDMISQGQVSASGIVCYCHGSQFTLTGDVSAGPARTPLPAYAVALGADCSVYVDPNSSVPSAQRLAV